MRHLKNSTHEQIDADRMKALADQREAQDKLLLALGQLRDAIATGLRCEAELVCRGAESESGLHAASKYLTAIAYENRSEWSGGPLQPSNIRERITREAAVFIAAREFR